MALFRSNTDPDAQVAKAEAERAKLLRLLTDAENTFAAATEQSNALALDVADDTVMKEAALAVRDAGDLVKQRGGALEKKDAELAVLIAARDNAADKKTRHATADEIEKMLADSGSIQRDLDSVLKRLAAFADWCAPFTPEAQGLLNYTIASRAQIPEALTLLQKLIGYHAQAVMAGTAPASLKRMTAPVVEPVKLAPVMTTVFAVKSIRWTDADGTKRITQRFKDVTMPPAFAKAALDNNVAVRLDDPRCKDRNSVGGNPEPQYAFDLDAAMVAKNAGPRLVETIRQSNPQFVETIGPPKRVSMS
jgi:hypothetical protein